MDLYVTDWFRVANSGKTVDGREIKPQDINDMAATYSVDQYRAMIWPEHNRYYNLGEVAEVKATDNSEGGRTLWAKLRPNSYYLANEESGQRLSFSIEITPNYRSTGKAYLTGLGATDSPASSGTDTVEFALKFAAKTGGFFGDYLKQEKLPETQENLFSQLLAFLKTNTPPTQQQEKNDMALSEEQFNQLKKSVDDVAEAQKKFYTSEAFEKFKADSEAGNKKFTDDLAALKTALAEKDTAFAALKTAHDELSAKFTAAVKPQPGTRDNEFTGGGSDKPTGKEACL
jgi:hypothetical protein